MKRSSRFRDIRRAKIVCTLGPSCDQEPLISRMANAGMDVVRLNFSHGTHEDHARLVGVVRDISRRIGRPMSIIADLQGPKIRTGTLRDKRPVQLVDGESCTITTERVAGDAKRFSTDYRHLPHEVKKGDRILIDDGLIELRVGSVKSREVRCEIVAGGSLSEHKGINLPGVKLSIPSLDSKDRMDLAFALDQGVDWIAVSFVRSAQDVVAVRRAIHRHGKSAQIIAKLEKAEALDNLEEILKVTDAVMVARGDLGVEMSPEEVPPAQKRIIRRASEHRLPVITATQMLDSMTRNPRPTRAEASDVANAVFDGTSALMLSNETASGRFPLEAVAMMDRIIRAAEAVPREREAISRRVWRISVADAISRGICDAAEALPMRCIAVFTETGRTARLISHYQPRCPIIAFSSNQRTRRGLALLWGVLPRKITRVNDIDELARTAEWRLVEEGIAAKGDIVGIVAGTPLNVAGTSNLVKLHIVGS